MGWFGGQIGATGWLVLLGVMLAARGHPDGTVVIALGLLPNLLGLALWQSRRAFNPRPATQLLIAASGLSAAAALVFLRTTEPHAGVGPVDGLPDPWLLVMYPLLMVALQLQDHLTRRHAGRPIR